MLISRDKWNTIKLNLNTILQYVSTKIFIFEFTLLFFSRSKSQMKRDIFFPHKNVKLCIVGFTQNNEISKRVALNMGIKSLKQLFKTVCK